MSDDIGGAGMEGLGGGEVKEASPAQIEQMKENLRKAAQAFAKSKRDEGNKRKKEKKLVELLIDFLQSDEDQSILSLVVVLLEKKVPIGVVVSILSLAFEEIEKTILDALEPAERQMLTSPEEREVKFEKELVVKEKQTFDKENLPAHVKERINEWIRLILVNAMEEKKETLDNMYKEGNLIASGQTLTALVLQKYCIDLDIETDLDDAKDFALFVLSGVKGQLDS